MGQVAEDMLDGTCCQCCGEWHPDIMAMAETADGSPVVWSPQGYPYTCAGCGGSQGTEEPVVHINPRKEKTIGCQDCERMFSSDYALSDHRRAKHG